MTETLPRVRFESAGHALQWADEVLDVEEVGNFLRGYRKYWQQAYKQVGGSPYTPEDYRDLASTIIVAWSQIEPAVHRLVLRECHGDQHPDRREQAAESIADAMTAVDPCRHWLTCRTIAHVAIQRQRIYEQRGKRPGLRMYAEELGISRQAVAKSRWGDLIAAAEGMSERSVRSGERELGAALQSANILAAEVDTRAG